MKGSESCIGCKSETLIINFHSQGKTFSRFYNNIDSEVLSRFEFKHFKYVETGSILRNGLSHKQFLVKMRGLILEASTSPKKTICLLQQEQHLINHRGSSSKCSADSGDVKACVVSGALNFSEELKQSNCGKMIL